MKGRTAVVSAHVSVITLNVSGLNSPIKRHRISGWIKKPKYQDGLKNKTQLYVACRRLILAPTQTWVPSEGLCCRREDRPKSFQLWRKF